MSSAGAVAEPDGCRVKFVSFLDRSVPILMQNENGPCPLLALANGLSLEGKVQFIQSKHQRYCSNDHIVAVLGEYLVSSNEHVNADAAVSLTEALGHLPTLNRGLDVNVRFRSCDSFEFTPELSVFDMLGVNLRHGWVADEEFLESVGDYSYNQAVDKIISCSSPAVPLPSGEETKRTAISQNTVSVSNEGALNGSYNSMSSCLSDHGTPVCTAEEVVNRTASPDCASSDTGGAKCGAAAAAELPAGSSDSSIVLDNCRPNTSCLDGAQNVELAIDETLSFELSGQEKTCNSSPDIGVSVHADPSPTRLSPEKSKWVEFGESMEEKSAVSGDSDGGGNTEPKLPHKTDSPGNDGGAALPGKDARSESSLTALSATENLAALELGSSRGTPPPPSEPEKGSTDMGEDQILSKLRNFLNETSSQLSYSGLVQLHSTVREREMSVLFRNNHFSTLFKMSGSLYCLVTDVGYADEADVVWERLSAVDGDSQLCDSNFEAFNPHSHQHHPTDSASKSTAKSTTQGYDEDLRLAMQIQQQEYAQAQNVASTRAGARAVQGGGYHQPYPTANYPRSFDEHTAQQLGSQPRNVQTYREQVRAEKQRQKKGNDGCIAQ